jgi:HSP20 family molecular chaperone IbpA
MKRSFFDRISGTVSVGDAFDEFDDTSKAPAPAPLSAAPATKVSARGTKTPDLYSSPAEGQLPVDMHQTPSEIVIRAFVAGVRPDELSISISRDMVVIEGSRMEREQVSQGDYFAHELFWGSFSRAITLPQEIDVDSSTANAKDGLLSIVLPKLDKARQTKLRVRAG